MAPSFSFYKVGITFAILSVFLSSSSALDQHYYSQNCPMIYDIVYQHVSEAITNESRMGASLLRLHFHDCFVNGCDGSVLLDDTPSFKGEKSAAPNKNSIRGFDVIDNIKADLEDKCPDVVSCADILALAAAQSVYVLQGPFYHPDLGRKDATIASQADANLFLPSPSSDLDGLLSKFNDVGLDKYDLIALSGAHTIGKARCITFRKRTYSNNEVIDRGFEQTLQASCPRTAGKGDDNLTPIDTQTSDVFDSRYYKNLVQKKGLFHSDQQLYSGNDAMITSVVKLYSGLPELFMWDFTQSMLKMGRISGKSSKSSMKGRIAYEIRKDCRKPNDNY